MRMRPCGLFASACLLGLSAAAAPVTLTVLSTNDRHSHYLGDPYDPARPAVAPRASIGGVARVASAFEEIRRSSKDVLVVDAGDFVDGTALINAEDGAADLNLLSYLGYDAACLGNHEMSLGPDGLAATIGKTETSADGRRVPLLCANIRFGAAGSVSDPLRAMYGRDGEPGKRLFPLVIRTTASGVKVGIFGLIGGEVLMPDALPCTFPMVYPEIQRLVDDLRGEEKVDVVICLAHASFHVLGPTAVGELPMLARNVTGIDLICAGHSHVTAMARVACEKPGPAWTTAIIEAGSYARFVGRTDIRLEGGRVLPGATKMEILAMDRSIPGKPEVSARIAGLISDVEANYLRRFPPLRGGRLFDVLAHAPFRIGPLNGMNLVADGLRDAADSDVALCSAGGDSAEVEPNAAGNITVYEAYAAISHGRGRDGLHGGALYKFDLFAAELRALLEQGARAAARGQRDFFLVPSGVAIEGDFAADGQAGGRILKMSLVSPDERRATPVYDATDKAGYPFDGWKSGPGSTGRPGDPRQLLSVSSSLLSLIGLKYVTESDRQGRINLWPRDGAGTQVKWRDVQDLDRFTMHGDGGYEVKAWYAVARYIDRFGGTVPSRYDDASADGKSRNPAGPPWRRVWDAAAHPAP